MVPLQMALVMLAVAVVAQYQWNQYLHPYPAHHGDVRIEDFGVYVDAALRSGSSVPAAYRRVHSSGQDTPTLQTAKGELFRTYQDAVLRWI